MDFLVFFLPEPPPLKEFIELSLKVVHLEDDALDDDALDDMGPYLDDLDELPNSLS